MLQPAAIRRLIDPEEVADAVAWLCSSSATSVTGSSLVMDGGWRQVTAVGLDTARFLDRRGPGLARITELLAATAGRAPRFGCFGLHEWAMVYRPDDGEVRHGIPLRLG